MVSVLMVAVELCALPFSVSVEASTEQLAYCAAITGAQVSATVPVNPFSGVSSSG